VAGHDEPFRPSASISIARAAKILEQLGVTLNPTRSREFSGEQSVLTSTERTDGHHVLERLFVEERRRLKIIPNAFGELAVLKLMFGALIRAAERWRSVKITEFEGRQIEQYGTSSIRNTRPRSASMQSLQMMKPSEYPATLGLDPVRGSLSSGQSSDLGLQVHSNSSAPGPHSHFHRICPLLLRQYTRNLTA
jgi:hypothetical protein